MKSVRFHLYDLLEKSKTIRQNRRVIARGSEREKESR